MLGPLHGIPVLLKDNIDTGDKMQTSAGSFALVGTPALQDSTVAANLRAGGAVILGKTNLSEWANFRSFESISGWSGRGGQTNNPYGTQSQSVRLQLRFGRGRFGEFCRRLVRQRDRWQHRLPRKRERGRCHSSRPLASLAVPVSCRFRIRRIRLALTGAPWLIAPLRSASFKAALSMDAIPLPAAFRSAGEARARPTNIPTDYTQFVNPNGLKGARIGITRVGLNGFDSVPTPQPVFEAIEASFQALTAAGATIIDLDAQGFVFPPADGEFFVLLYDFKGDVANYFATRVGVPVAGGNLQMRSTSTMPMPMSRCHSSTRISSSSRRRSCAIRTRRSKLRFLLQPGARYRSHAA